MSIDLVGRVQRLLLAPKTEWDAIDGEAVDRQQLLTGYVAPLAAIPAIATVIGLGVVGGFGLVNAVVAAAITFAWALAWVFVFAFIIDSLAPTFGATRNFGQAFKVAAFAPTAAWVAGVFNLIPALGILVLIGALYSLYLLFLGLPKLMKPAPDKAVTYTIAAIVVSIVAMVLIGMVTSAVTPRPSLPGYSAANDRASRAAEMESAAARGDLAGVLGAAGALSGEAAKAPVVDAQALRDFAPNRIAGLSREEVEVESLTAPIKAVMMTARYQGGGKSVDLKIMNSPMIGAMTSMLGLAGGAYDRNNSDGFERLRREGRAIVVEEWSKSRKTGRYGRMVGESYFVEASGEGVELAELERAVKSISESALNHLPHQRP